jgi:phosphoribosylformylglycinamidine cyclo-ligase
MTSTNTYAAAGVNIAAGQRAVNMMTSAVRATYGSEVLAGIGAFGGLFDATRLKMMESPVLVGSTDGVGTKTKVAARLGRWNTIGRDLVNHCINDILVQGAEPLFFMDYVASAKLDAAQIATVVTGVAEACREAHFALLGGETAEMPGVYEPGELDLAGTIVGVVDRKAIIDGSRVQPGDVVLGLPSTGLHTNGFSLARQVLKDLDWDAPLSNTPGTIGDALLAVHRPYLSAIRRLWQAGIEVRAMAHITGGGFVDNFPRVLPLQVSALVQRGTWPELPIFALIQHTGKIATDEMFHVFNMGLGMLIVIPPDQATAALHILDGESYQVGQIVRGQHEVLIR